MGNTETFDSLWAHCSANNRVVPMPQEWSKLYNMLADTRQNPNGGWGPPMQLILAAWHEATPIQKTLRLRQHIQWASDHDQLAEVAAFLHALPEEKWLHVRESR